MVLPPLMNMCQAAWQVVCGPKPDPLFSQDGAFLLVGKDLLRHVVDHHWTFEIGYGWISAVLLLDE